MQTFKFLTFTALAATLLFQTPSPRAGDRDRQDDRGRGHNDQDQRDATVTFTKWVTDIPNQPGLIATMEGVVGGGAAGRGTFAGEVLKWDTSGPVVEIVAFYHVTGLKHSFSVVVHVLQEQTSLRGVITGVVADGWMKGHAVKGEYTQYNVGPNPYGIGLPIPYFVVTLEIDRDSND